MSRKYNVLNIDGVTAKNRERS